MATVCFGWVNRLYRNVFVARWAVVGGPVAPYSCSARRAVLVLSSAVLVLDRLRGWSATPAGSNAFFMRLSPGALRDPGLQALMPSA